MSGVYVRVRGTVKFFNKKKGYGFISVAKGDCYIGSLVAGDKAELLKEGAEVIVDYAGRYVQGKGFKLDIKTLHSVRPVVEPEPVVVLDTVEWFRDDMGYGFINCAGAGLSKDRAHIHMSVVRKCGMLTLVPDMPMRAIVIETAKGPNVVSFEWGQDIEAEYLAKMAELHAEDGAQPVPVVDEDDEIDQLLNDWRNQTMEDLGQIAVAVEPVVAAAKPKAESAPKKPAAKKTPAKKATSTAKASPEPVDVVALVAAAASNGSGGAVAEALTRAVGGNA